ncbi:MAG: DUF1727 domain-containing protein [Oscillospiraceae bacterium]|nr:DUF1727 domain-containing protein [Oscillospiraceae bacterium]
MNIRVPIAILACHAVRLLARILHKGGTAKPGEIALRICPELLSILSQNVKTVVITGTNGKTTTARMVEQAFADAGLDYIVNRSGANLISGITTEFALKSSLLGRCRCTHAVIECDEAACRRTLAQLKPQAVLVSNLFRDQLDRFGDVTVTFENIREGLEKVPETTICVNADCPLCSRFAELSNPVVYFGLESGAVKHSSADSGDVKRCSCGGELEYAYRAFGHLGGWSCPECGKKRHETDPAVTALLSANAAGSRVAMRINGEETEVNIHLPALYNVYNAVGAAAALKAMGFESEAICAALESFSCGFGRMESLPIGAKGARMMLVKNPTGCERVQDFLSGMEEEFELVICLNDRAGDGTDISWIWETGFEKLARLGDTLSCVRVSGIRWADMALRLKYAGIPEEKIKSVPDYARLTDAMAAADKPTYIIPTYSAMLELRSHIVRRTGGAEFWEG